MAKSWFKAKARGDKSADILIYSDIGDFGVTAADFQNTLERLGERDSLNVRIQSDGGDVFQGFAIYNILRRQSARVVVTIDGLAASMASVIAMAGDEVVMPQNAMLMIHNPWGGVQGGSQEIISFGEALDKMAAGILAAYRERTGMDDSKLKKMMDRETWLNADEAVSMGFADRIEEPVAMAASAFNLDRFAHVPASFGRSLTRKGKAMKSKTARNAAAAEEGSLDLEEDVPEAQTPKEIRAAILAQHAEVRSLCALAGKPALAQGFIDEDKTPADVLKALDDARKADAEAAAKKGKGGVSARHQAEAPGIDPKVLAALDATDIYARWNSAAKR